jgi:hypothetical protein
MTFKKTYKRIGVVVEYTIKDKTLKYMEGIMKADGMVNMSELLLPFENEDDVSKVNVNIYSIQMYKNGKNYLGIAYNLGDKKDQFVARILWEDRKYTGLYNFLDNQPVWHAGIKERTTNLVKNTPMPKEIGNKFREIGKELNISEDLEKCLKAMESKKFRFHLTARGQFI